MQDPDIAAALLERTLMATVQTAMLGRLPFTLLRDAIFTHPTAAEGLTVLVADVGTTASSPSRDVSPSSFDDHPRELDLSER